MDTIVSRNGLSVCGESFVGDRHTNVVRLHATASSNNKTTFRTMGGSTYQVGGSTTLKIFAVDFKNAATAGANPALVYADNDLGFNSGGALTNPVYLATGSSTANSNVDLDAYERYCVAVDWQIPSNKFPVCEFFNGTGSCIIYGIEE